MVDTTPNKNPIKEYNEVGSQEELNEAASKRKYVQVGNSRRKELLQIINDENLTIKSAAEKLNINYSNAKNIVKLFKREHRTEKFPKKPILTLHDITYNPHTIESNPYRAALLPFYDPTEEKQLMHKHNAKRSLPLDSPDYRVEAPFDLKMHDDVEPNSHMNTAGQTGNQLSGNIPCSKKSVPLDGSSTSFDFMAYTSMILTRYYIPYNNSFTRRFMSEDDNDSAFISMPERTLPSPFLSKEEKK